MAATLAACILVAVTAVADSGRLYTADKLTSSLISCISQDKYGYIWVGTENGLNKFDGYRFTNYIKDNLNENDSTSLIYIFLQFAFGSTAGFCVITSLRIGAEQGMGKSAFVLGAGVGELVARVLICLFLPSAISGGAVDASSGSAAFFALCTADPLAWFAADAVLAFSFIPHVARCGKGGRRRKNMLSAV